VCHMHLTKGDLMAILRQSVVSVAVAGLLVSSGIGAALADPTRGRQAISASLACAGEELAVVSANEPTPTLQVTSTTSVLIATDGTLTITYVDPQTDQPVTEVQHQVFGAGHGDAAGLETKLITCDRTVTVQDPNLGAVTLRLTGTFILTPLR
jgi:hypothetical protein